MKCHIQTVAFHQGLHCFLRQKHVSLAVKQHGLIHKLLVLIAFLSNEGSLASLHKCADRAWPTRAYTARIYKVWIEMKKTQTKRKICSPAGYINKKKLTFKGDFCVFNKDHMSESFQD